MKTFEYLEPKTLQEAIAALKEWGEGARLLAGGTNLVPAMKARTRTPGCIVNLKGIEGLDEVHEDKSGIRIGALVRLSDLAQTDVPRRRKFAASVEERIPLLLRQIIGLMANPQVRNVATLPGNLAWGSPAADSAPPLLALDAQLAVLGSSGERTIDLDEFFKGPGETALGADEVITQVVIPDKSLKKSGDSVKLMKRKANTLAVCSAAVSFTKASGKGIKDVRIAVGAVAPVPMRVKAAEKLLEGQVADDDLLIKVKEEVAAAITPITDVRSTAWYRKQVTPVLVERCIKTALS